MDRQIVYPGQILPETALLQMAKDAMIGSAKLAAAMLGTSTIANGFAVTPTGPASLQIVVAPGEIYAMANIDSLAFSTLPADTTHSILKQGIMLDGVTLSCPAPTTTGQSINYLVQVTYQDQDSTPVLLPYYNSANPALPYSGMGNNGLTQNTSRKGVAIVQVKAGASAATGSQVTPAPDSGYVGLFVATVAYGQTTITSGNITQYAGAPLLPSGVLQSIQGGNTTYALDTGAVNACAATFFPAITALVDGLTLRFKAANSNNGATTFSPNGISAAPIVGGNHAALQGGEIAATGDVWVQWNSSIGGGSWVLVESSGGGLQVASGTKSQHAISAGQAQAQSVTAFTTAGVSTALTLTPVPAITAYAANQRFRVKFGLDSTGADTLNISGLGAKSIKQYDFSGAKVAAVFAANQLADVEYDGVDFVLLDQLPSIADFLNTPRINVASAATVNLTTSAPDTRNIAITGAINIAGVTVAAGRLYFVTFLGALTLINSATLVTQSGMNITTAPGDTCILRATAANTVEVLCYTPGIPQAIGYLQTTQNMASARFVATDYTNTSGRPILLSVYASVAASNILSLLVNGVVVAQNTINNSAPGANSTLTFVILPGQVYRVNSVVGLAMWTEIRV
ncbi:hypothetical protein [Pseudomonas extremaustralis]|uniref:Uncharacterized protein n=1 Tax=Pseudomonas extremaustralis TaxID=359110 RepID=A0A5C5Q789_9PSED|nr:hypothetical protein [Pseudomonas extremaustralis]EZI23787.1 hypothetical protein PE143B_0129835 [Pseudomonas extremaustralis 14-3 substr. 14-3b]TWS01494.1 hypothetical protein FIV36_24855 [Pseudomonas extremaustralis]SDG46639.1 hypothetical protein SAMN05216591_6169 [Pseudomonas extremaustralis]